MHALAIQSAIAPRYVGAWPKEITHGGTVIGRVALDRSGRLYRYFPGADNDVAYVFEHGDLGSLLRLIENRSWELELQQIKTSPRGNGAASETGAEEALPVAVLAD